MEIKYIFSFMLLFNGVFALYYAGRYILEKHERCIENRIFVVLCIASSIWSFGFGLMFPQETEHGAYLCRSFGIFGTFLYMMTAQKLLCCMSSIKYRYQLWLNGISYWGLFIYGLTIQPDQTSYQMTRFGMTYEFAPGIVNLIYNIYFIVVVIDIGGLTIYMLRKGSRLRVKTFGKRFLVVEIFIVAGTALDVLLPTFGSPALPGSNVTQFWGIIVIWFAMHANNRTKITIRNMTEYIYDSLDIPVLVFDQQRDIKIMNESAGLFLDIRQIDLTQRPHSVEEFFAVKEVDLFEVDNTSIIVDGKCKVNGAICQLAVSKIYDAYHDVLGYIMIVNDVTTLNDAMRRFEEASQEAKNANKAKSIFLANMSHEIRTPMNAIVGFSELALQEDLSDEVKDDIVNIKNSSESLLAIINDILDISKIESGRMELVEDEFEMNALITSVNTIIRSRAKAKGLNFELHLDERIPSKVYGDITRIREILINLLNNSVKYTRQGEVELRVSVDNIEGDICNLRFAIIDTGIGIKEENKKYLFDSFSRVDTKKNAQIEGTGLGLAIVKGYVELMGGNIDVESLYGVGSKFTVFLGLKIMDSSPMDLKISKSGKNHKEYSIGDAKYDKTNVLVVDDNIINRKVIQKSMEHYGLTVELAENGEEAVEKCRSREYPIVFMDQMMPVMDGVEAMHRIRDSIPYYGKSGPGKIVVLTANAILGVREQLLKEGFDEYLEKPMKFPELERVLKLYLGKDEE